MTSTALTVYTGSGVQDDSIVSYPASRPAGTADRCPFVGLSNQGATCYMNSLLQTLYMTPEFRSALYRWQYEEGRDGTRDQCIALQLQRLFGLLQLSKTRAIDTVALTKSFGWEGSEVFQQQDVQELCRVLFDAIEDTFRGTDVDNIIDDLYAGELVDYLKCVDVDYQSDRRDKFLDYSLAITPFGSDVAMHSIHECVEHFLEPEILDGDNQYFVESVGRKADAIKGLKFGRLPQIMSVQLKRFVYDFSGDIIVNKKINEEVRFPFILDLNKYVSSGDGVQGEGGSDAFDLFLAERIQRLRQKRRGSSMDSIETLNKEVIGGISVQVGGMPDLVDSEGNLCPELLADRLVEAVEESEEEKFLRRCYSDAEADNFSKAELQELIAHNGPWIYELFAVMIHSGAITGGHYYAYIKDLSSEKWYDFNDSSVTEIQRQKVKEAWGGEISVPIRYNSNYYGISCIDQTTKVKSTANAYMLMYRRIKGASDDTINMPSDDEVPQYVRSELKRLEEEEAAKKKLDEERYNKLVVRVVWNDKEYSVSTNRKKTYIEFLTQLWTELRVFESPKLADWVESHPPTELDLKIGTVKVGEQPSFRPVHIPFDRIRLRQYNSHLRVPQDIHDVEVNGESTLQKLQILDYRCLVIECRALGEEWEEYIQNGINILAMIYDPTEDTLISKNVRLLRNASVLELKEKLHQYVDYGIGDMRLMKLTALGVSDIRKEEFADDTAQLELRCRIYEGSKVFLENKSEYIFEESPAVKCFIKSINTITVNISSIGKTYFDIKLVVDRRMTFEDFRKKIAETVNMEPNTFRIHRHIVKGQELQYAGHETLQMVSIYDGVSLALSEGTPLKPGFSSISLVLFDNKCAGGIRNLTDLTFEEAVQKYGTTKNVGLHMKMEGGIQSVSVRSDMLSVISNAEYNDSIVRAASEWSPAKIAQKADDFVDAVDAVPLALPELVVEKRLTGSTHVDVENNLADVEELIENGDADESIGEAVVLSPSTSMNVLSRAVSGDVSGINTSASDEPGAVAFIDSSNETAVEDDEYMFGYRKVDLAVSAEQFTLLMNVVVEGSYLISDLRKDVLNKLKELKKIPVDAPPSLVRLREKWNIRAGAVLRDGLTLREHNVSLVEGRELAVQILSSPDAYDIPLVRNPVQGDCVLFVQRWHRSTWTLGDRMEVYIPGSWPVNVIVGCLAELVNIRDKDNMKVLIVQPHYHISIALLAENAPSEGRRWANVSNEASRLYDMQWYLSNGDLLLLQDSTEPLRALTEKERLSTLRAREADVLTSYSASIGSTFLWPEDRAPKIANRPVGIHIRKHNNNNDQKDDQGIDDPASSKDDLQSSDVGPSDIEGFDENDKSKAGDDVNDMMLL